MAINDIVQTIAEARVDARSLSEFVFKPAGFKVARRLAPPVDTLQFYIDRFNSLNGDFSSSVYAALSSLNNSVTEADGKVTYIETTVQDAITNTVISSGFVTIDSFELGAAITQRNQALRHAADGKLYRWAGNLPKAVPVNSTPTSTGGFGANAWLEVSDTVLRQELSSTTGFSKANATGYFTGIEQLSNFESLPIGSVVTETKSGITFVKTGGVNTINGFKPTGDTVLLSWFGVTEGDLYATPKVNTAINFAHEHGYAWVKSDVSGFRVAIDKATKSAMIMRNNVSIDLTDTVVTLEATDAGLHYMLNCRKDITGSVVIKNGTLVGDRANHLGTIGEWGMGVSVLGANKVTIDGTVLRDFWGDGIYIAADITGGGRVKAGRVIVNDVVCDNNRRQGMSITDVDEVEVYGGKFINTNGALPESGIDIEPDSGGYIGKVSLYNVLCEGNAGHGLLASVPSSAHIGHIKIGTLYTKNNQDFGVRLTGNTIEITEIISSGNNGTAYLALKDSAVVGSIHSSDNSFSGSVGGVITLGGANVSIGKIFSKRDTATGADKSILSILGGSESGFAIREVQIEDATYTFNGAIMSGNHYESIIIDVVKVKNLSHGIIRFQKGTPSSENDGRIIEVGTVYAKNVNTSGSTQLDLIRMPAIGSKVGTVRIEGVGGAVDCAIRVMAKYCRTDYLLVNYSEYLQAPYVSATNSEVVKSIDLEGTLDL